jgi:hypothetical protein|tara:strand:- start:2687 stop:3088 length:402 start_codon:yes stop_codon:yes gene_type:complete
MENTKGHDGSYQMLPTSHTRQDLVDRLKAVTAACGDDWDFDGDAFSKEEAAANLRLMASADVCYEALLRDEARVDGTTAGIAPGSGNKGVIKDEVVQEIAEIWNANCPAKYRKDKPLVGLYLDEQPTPTGGII